MGSIPMAKIKVASGRAHELGSRSSGPLLEKALLAKRESTHIEFKEEFDPTLSSAWCEVIKDIVAIANSGGGIIVFGLDSRGVPTGRSVDKILDIDPAMVTDKLHSYTEVHFADFGIHEISKAKSRLGAFQIGASRVPIVFTSPGTYAVDGAKQKTAFAKGTLYFRHGAKSEPGTSEDLRAFVERELETIKRSWLDGITKVVEAPAGSSIAILPQETQPASLSGAIPLRITDDPNAPAHYQIPIDTTHPYRQKEVVEEVNNRLAGRKKINSRDIFCIRRVFPIQKNISYCYIQNYSAPRYSQMFVDWIMRQFDDDPNFFEKTRQQFDKIKEGAA